MKRLSFFALLTIIFINCVQGQKLDDNTLFIKTDLKGIENLLLINFYEVEKIDSIRFSTKSKPIEGSVYAYDLKVSLHGVIIGEELMIFANYSFRGGVGTQETYSGRASYQRRQNIGKRLAFDEMVRVFEQLDKPIIYKNMK
jgi:hypothetical protein